MAEQPCFTLIHVPQDADFLSENDLKKAFENGTVKEKVKALKCLILMIQSGEKVNQTLLMYVIRFCLPSSDHYLKKLLLIFWEVVPKTSADGKLLDEFILVCDAYRKDLQHPNEFVRGSTLRFLCKLKEPELLEPLMLSIRKCLEHRHSYVRRNAVVAIFTIYKNFEFLISDGSEVIANFLEIEQDASCKRNAFMMLLHVDQNSALEYLSSCVDQVITFGDILQLIIVELIYKVCYNNPTERGRFIRCIYNLLQSQSPAVRYEAAGTLITLSSTPTAIKAAASTYIELIVKESDNNVKLIVLDRLINLRENAPNEKVLQELVMNIACILSATDYNVRKKILHLTLDLVSSRNVQELVTFLKKEIDKTTNNNQEDVGNYRKLLVQTLHSAAIKFPSVAQQIIPVFMEFLSDQTETAASDVLIFIREVVQMLPNLRPVIIQQLLDVFPSIKNGNFYRSALWILGEYSNTTSEIETVFSLVRNSIGEIPIVESEQLINLNESDTQSNKTKFEQKDNLKSKNLVTADGTYATQSALVPSFQNNALLIAEKPILRKLLLDGNFFVAAALGNDLSKLIYRFADLNSGNISAINKLAGEACLIISTIIHLGKSDLCKTKITEDDLDRLSTTLNAIVNQWPGIPSFFIKNCREALNEMLIAKDNTICYDVCEKAKKHKIVQAETTILFTQLASKVGDNNVGQNLFELSLSQALGTAPKTSKYDFATSKLGKVLQLAGFSDPVYAEAYVNVNQYDITLDVLIVNQTSDTLQNLTLELSTVGDLKLVDKPSPLTLAPYDFTNIKATVKVASTENGVIFSIIAYDIRGSTSDRNCVYLEDIHIDIMDYIMPGTCTDTEFRTMWAEFEWENKVAVVTPITNLRQYLNDLSIKTNMKMLTAEAALDGECGFLAANLCAHSIFGEEALANVSIEKSDPLIPESAIIGHVRIRAKSQGMALSLGDKIKALQSQFSNAH